MNTELYPEMDKKIVSILRISDEPSCKYAANLIESLQADLAESRRRERAAVAAVRDLVAEHFIDSDEIDRQVKNIIGIYERGPVAGGK